MKSPLRWPGGKSKLAGVIVQRIPAHRAYVETCCGGASVFWAKPQSQSVCEILNDADGELINFYYQLHKRGRRLAREVDSMPYGRAFFVGMRLSHPRSPFARACRFWYLNRVAFGAKRRDESFGVKATMRGWVLPPGILSELDATIERLRGVIFESVDLRRLLRLYDRVDSFFYLDPPYYGTSQAYACQFSQADHAELASALVLVQGRWLLSYNDHPWIRKAYAQWTLAPLSTRYTMGCNSGTGGSSDAQELLISNYAQPGMARSVNATLTPRRRPVGQSV